MTFKKQNNSRAPMLKLERNLLISPSYTDKLFFRNNFIKENPFILMTIAMPYISIIVVPQEAIDFYSVKLRSTNKL